MTSFVETCVGTMSTSAQKVEPGAASRLRARRLIRTLAGKRDILVTAHAHPDPDALASVQAMQTLLRAKLPDARVTIRFKGQLGGGLNAGFVRLAGIEAKPWDDAALGEYDAIVLVDCQPSFANNPLPPGLTPTAVVDHHRGRGKRPAVPFCDIRTDVGAASSLLFSYFIELQVPIPPELAAPMLYAIESDLAGAAGQQGGLDTIAIASLTLLADTRKLAQMRYVRLPEAYYSVFGKAIERATRFGEVVVSHLDLVPFAEVPAVMADFLLRCHGTTWVLVTANHDGRLIFSLRTGATDPNAADIARRLVRGLGDGGGHRTKAGGAVAFSTVPPPAAELDCVRSRLCQRLLRLLRVPNKGGRRIEST